MSSPLEELNQLFLEDPSIYELDLSARSVVEISPALLSSIAKFGRLRRLDLSSNSLSSLPDDLSRLSRLEAIHLHNNPLRSLESFLPALLSLPSLLHLTITLRDELMESRLLSRVRLATLNGKACVVSGLDYYSDDPPPKQPDSVTRSNSDSLPRVDSEEEMLLMMRLSDEDEDDGQPTIPRSLSESSFPSNPNPNRTSLLMAHHSYDDVKTRGELEDGEVSPKVDEDRERAFVSLLRRLVSRTNRIRESGKSFEQIVGLQERERGHPFGDLELDLESDEDESVTESESAGVTLNLLQKQTVFRYALESLREYFVDDALGDCFDGLRMHCDEFFFHLGQEVRTLREKMLKQVRAEKTVIRSFQDQEEGLRTRIRELKDRLQTMKDAKQEETRLGFSLPESSAREEASASKGVLMRNISVVKRHAAKLQRSSVRSKKTGYCHKEMSLTKLKSFILEIYEGKEEHDRQCKLSKLPIMTLERYFYHHLRHRLRLRSLVLEWARTVFHAVNQFSEGDIQVKLFGLVMKNEVDEGFRSILRELRDTAEVHLRSYLEDHLRGRSSRDVDALLKRKMKGFLYEAEWLEIVDHLYKESDARTVVRLVRQSVRAASTALRVVDYKIEFQVFLQVLQDFQLASHVNFLADFRKLWTTIDTDKDGVLSSVEFATLVRRLDPSQPEPDIGCMLFIIDEHRNDHITFSESCDFFCREEGGSILTRMALQKQRLLREQAASELGDDVEYESDSEDEEWSDEDEDVGYS